MFKWFLKAAKCTEVMNGPFYSGSRGNPPFLDRKKIIDVSKGCEIKDIFS